MEVNKKQLAEIFGASIRTIQNWQEQGMPVLRGGGKGNEVLYDSAAVIKWYAERDAEIENEKLRREVEELRLASEADLHPGTLEFERHRLTRAQATAQVAPLGCGWVIWRDEEALPQELVFNVDYLGGQIGTFAINFSRPAGQVIAQYYEFLRLGREGYTKVQNASYQVAAYLADEIAKLGPYEFICTGRPDEGIPAVCFKLKDGEDPGYTLYDLSERLRLRGWQVPAFTLGGEATDIVVMRIMCRRGFEMDFAELLLEDYKASLKYLSDHPKLQGIAQQNSFKHT